MSQNNYYKLIFGTFSKKSPLPSAAAEGFTKFYLQEDKSNSD
jgi:hypothetical protein